MRYFKKYDPRNPIYAGAGFQIQFQEPVENGGWGLLATNDTYIIKELERCIREERGGVAEVEFSEFEALKKKENQILLPTWREAIPRARLVRMLRALQERDAADIKGPKEVFKNFHEARVLAKPQGKSTYIPRPRNLAIAA
jgi:hypothetical protein